MWITCRRILVAGVVLCSLNAGASAFAAGWPLGADAPVVCGYAEEYARPDGSTAVHTGVDIEAAEGESALAVEGGTVIFAGSVPAANGGTVIAVTVQSASGDKWSYLPLSEATVAQGDQVSAGGTLGAVAGLGDASSKTSHVHVGVRRGERYVDPTALLIPPVLASAQPEPATAAAPAPAVESASSSADPATVTTANDAVAAPASSPVQAPAVAAQTCGAGAIASDVQAQTAPASSAAPAHTVSTAAVRDRESGLQPGAATASPASTGASIEVGQPVSTGTSPKVRDGVGLPTRALVALIAFAPVLGVTIKRAIRSRVSAPGDTVAAAAGR